MYRHSAFQASLLALVFALGACSSGDNSGRRTSVPQGGALMQALQVMDVSSRAYSQAIQAKSNGDCARAVPQLYGLALRGSGFELAQYHLADCLMQSVERTAVSTDYLEALVWMRRAAEAGSPEAQAALAAEYLDGPADLRDRQQAAQWYVLYRDNGAKNRPGFKPINRDRIRHLEAAFSPGETEAAESWADNFEIRNWRAPMPLRGGGAQDDETDGQQLLEIRERRQPPQADTDGDG